MNMNEAKKYKVIIISLILVNVLIIGIWWFFNIKGQPERENRKNSGQWRHNRNDFFEEALKLDSAQRIVFKEMNDRHMTRLGRTNVEVDSLKNQIKIEIFKSNPNPERIDSLFKMIAGKRTTIDTSIYYHFKRLRNVCRPNQVASFDSLMNNFIKRKDKFGPMRDRNERQEPPHNNVGSGSDGVK